MKNTFRNIKSIITAFVIATAIFTITAIPLPAYAVGNSVNEEVINQSRAIASLIQTRVQIYWSNWIDKQIPYTQDPFNNPEPTWATDNEIASNIGGYNVTGISFTVESMPAERKGSFYLKAIVGDNMGGAAAASYVRNFLPMAVSSGNEVTVPVLRPSFALGLNDLADNPNKVNRDATTDDSSATFNDGANITFGKNASLTFDPITGGDINNINNLSAKNGAFSNNLDVGNKLTANNADIGTLNVDNLRATNPIDGNLKGNVIGNLTGNTYGIHTGSVVGNVNGDVTGNLYGNADSATRLTTSRIIALGNGATGSASFDGTGNIVIQVSALNSTSLIGRIDEARLTGTYNMTAANATKANYANGAGFLKDTDGDINGNFTIKPLSGGYVEFGGASNSTVKFGATGAVQPTDYYFGTAGDATVHANATSATKLAVARTIALGAGAVGSWIFDGTQDITIPVTALNSDYLIGRINEARLTGNYNITAANATNAVDSTNATNVTGGVVTATTGNFSETLTVAGPARINNDLMIQGSNTDRGITFAGTGGEVGNVANWRLLHSASGEGDANYFSLQTTGSGGSLYSDAVKFGMDTKDAVFYGNVLPGTGNRTIGNAANKWNNIYATTITGTLSGNASSATKLATARMIALSTGATGSIAFDGTKDIVIPVTALNASNLNAGTVGAGRLTGTYNIGVSGNAGSATRLSAARNINGVAFDGTSNITVADATKLATSGGTMTGPIILSSAGGNWITGLTDPAPLNQDLGANTVSYIPIIKQRHTNNTFSMGGYNNSFGIYRYLNSRVDNGYDSSFIMNSAGNMVATGSVIAPTFTGDLTGKADSAVKLADTRTIALGTGATGTATAFNGTGNITIPVTALNAGYLNAGTIATGRMSGTYNIGITGKAATAGTADTATKANYIQGNYKTQSSYKDPAVNVAIIGTPNDRDTWIYRDPLGGANNWGIYHRNIDSAVEGLPANAIGFIGGGNSALKAYIGLTDGQSMFGSTTINPNNSGSYNEGLRLNKASNNYASLMLGTARDSLTGITPNMGQWLVSSNPSNNFMISDESSSEGTGLVIYGDGSLPSWKGVSLASINSNVASATKLAVARTIALGTGATGTATAFDGTGNITIPVSGLNAAYLNNGVIPTGRLAGTYNMSISGKASTAGIADNATSANTAVQLTTARNLNVTGAATGTAVSFNGTGDANINITQLDPTKLVNIGSNSLGVRYNVASYNTQSNPTGAVKITLPGAPVDMFNIEIDVYEYNAFGASKIIIGGHTWTSLSWHNPSVSIQGAYNKGVKLGYDGANFCIVLGTPTTVWNYPKINVSKITGGYGNNAAFTSTWAASLIASEDGIINTSTPAPIASQSATKLATARTITLGTGATGSAVFDGTANIVIPVTGLNASNLNAGTVNSARMSGTYNIGITGKAATAGAADTATSAAIAANATTAGTATNVNGGSINATSGTFSSVLTANRGIQLNTSGSLSTGISYYNPSYTSWQTLMSQAGIGGGVAGNVISPAGTYVNDWAVRNIAEPGMGYGWTWESLASTGTITTMVAELDSISGNFKTKGTIIAPNFEGALTGNASSATSLITARTIALNTAVVGTATAFDGTANINIPVTALNAAYLSSGIVPGARMSGTYGINISGTARYAQELSTPLASVQYAVTAGTATNLNGGYVNATTGVFSSTVSAPNFHDSVGIFNVNLGGYYGRGISAGYSGGNYGGVGYNVQHTASSGSYIAPYSDTVSYLRFSSGGFEFLSSPSGAAGRSISFSTPAVIYADGRASFGSTVYAPVFAGALSGNASSATYATTAGSVAGGGGMSPNYNGVYSVSNNTTYTASTNGYLMVSLGGSSSVVINGRAYLSNSTVDFCSKHEFDTYNFPIRKGDTYRVSSNRLIYLYFVPAS